jgi:hypothetical protein
MIPTTLFALEWQPPFAALGAYGHALFDRFCGV